MTALPLLLVTVFLNIAGFSLVLPLLPFYGTLYGASPFMVASLFAAYSLGSVFGEIYWGRRSDIIGRRPVLILTTAGAALSYVAFAFAPTYALAIGIRVISGFFSGTFGVAASTIADITPPQTRAKHMGYFGAAFNLGFATGPAIGGLLANPAAGLPGFRAPILAAAALAAAASIWAAIALPETRPSGAGVRPAPSYSEALRYVGSQGLLLRLFLIAFCGIGAFASMEAVFGLWTERNFGWGTREVGLTFLAVGGTGLLVQTLAIGPLVARFGEARVITGGLLLLVLAIVLPPVIRLPAASVVLMSLLMAGHSLAFPNAGALVSRTTPPDRQGSVMGLNMASNAFSRIVAPPFFGWVFARHADAPYYLCALLMLAMVPVALQVARLRDRA
ncbi:MAG TPA: MFS transporter [Steroidobacteraceae bacterium]|nr:MFS transporter [Steroidobacteraceae bacterium]